MNLGSIGERRRVLVWLKNLDRKYRRPFETGEMNIVNIAGGSWNEYAAVVFSMLTSETLLNIEQQLRLLNENLAPEKFTAYVELENAGGMRWTHTGQRYLFGETLEPHSYGIWDRTEPGPPLERFPHTDEGYARGTARLEVLEPGVHRLDEPVAGSPPT